MLQGETDRYHAAQKTKARGSGRIGVMPGLAEGERGEGHDLNCDGSLEGHEVPAALPGAAQLRAGNCSARGDG